MLSQEGSRLRGVEKKYRLGRWPLAYIILFGIIKLILVCDSQKHLRSLMFWVALRSKKS
jgi:hypothetical protein